LRLRAERVFLGDDEARLLGKFIINSSLVDSLVGAQNGEATRKVAKLSKIARPSIAYQSRERGVLDTFTGKALPEVGRDRMAST
jgi:hypothetical protein